MAALRWTVLIDGPLPGAVNMARDVALAELVSGTADRGAVGRDPDGRGASEARPAFLRFYAWERPTLSFGRNEPARDRFDPDALEADGIDVVRRPTGGRAVLHDREVTYAVVVPDRALGGPRDTYRRISRALVAGLSTLGADVQLAPDAPTPGLDAGPCFDLPAGGEVIARGRKLVGSAQARIGGALLQHGSILLENDQGRLAGLGRPGGAPSPSTPGARPVALRELLDRPPTTDAVVSRVIAAMAGSLPGHWPGEVARPYGTSADPYPVPDATIERFEQADWTWRC